MIPSRMIVIVSPVARRSLKKRIARLEKLDKGKPIWKRIFRF